MLMGLRRQIQQTANPLASAMAQGTGSQLDVAGIISSLPSRRGGLFGRTFGTRPQGGGGLAGIAQRVKQGMEGGLEGEVAGGLQDMGPMRRFMESRQGGNTGGLFGSRIGSLLAAVTQQVGRQGGVAAPGDPSAGAGPAANAFRAVGMFR